MILIYEFVIPSQIFMFDEAEWPPLTAVRDGLTMRIMKPRIGQKLVSVLETTGNEGIDLHYSVMHVQVETPQSSIEPEWNIAFKYFSECLTWIRVAAQQYWVGVFISGTASIARGSIISESGKIKNFGAYQTPITPKPLTSELWQFIGARLAAGDAPNVPDIMFCDALLHFRDYDYLQAIIGFGVCAELALNALIDDFLPLKDDAVRDLYSVSRLPFAWKLKNMPRILGLPPYQEHNDEWTNDLCRLYELRGSAVHRAQLEFGKAGNAKPNPKKEASLPAWFENTSRFMFAVADFLHWTKILRERADLPVWERLNGK